MAYFRMTGNRQQIHQVWLKRGGVSNILISDLKWITLLLVQDVISTMSVSIISFVTPLVLVKHSSAILVRRNINFILVTLLTTQ